MKQMVMVYFIGLIAGFILASLLTAYEISKCLKTGKPLGGKYQIIALVKEDGQNGTK